MTKDELRDRLLEIANRTSSDTERDHLDVDEALLDYVDDPEIREIIKSIGGWYA